MFSFVVALSASAMGSPVIGSDAESGILQTIVARPLRRSEILFGKWLGLVTVLAGYAAIVSGLEFGAVRIVSGFAAPNPFLVAVYLFAEGAALLSLTFVLSVRLSPIAAGVIGIAVFGCAWLAGVVGSLGTTFHIVGLRDVGSIARATSCRLTACGTARSTTSSRAGSSPARLPPSATELAIRFSPRPRHQPDTSSSSCAGSLLCSRLAPSAFNERSSDSCGSTGQRCEVPNGIDHHGRGEGTP